MESPGNCSHWAEVSTEIWSTILMQVSSTSNQWHIHGSNRIHKLNLVCTSLRDIIQNQACLHKQVLLPELSSSQVPSLLAYIHQHGHAVNQYQENVNIPATKSQSRLVLAALLASAAPLRTILLSIPHLVLEMVPAFKMLRRCTFLNSQMTETVNLEPLQALQNLQHLTLQYGVYDNIQAAAVQLTTLELTHCNASCMQRCQCVTSLKTLKMVYAELAGLHNDGLLACSQLEAFKCNYSYVQASSPRHSFDFCTACQQGPIGLTALTKLTRLEVQHGAKDGVSVVTLDWVAQVPSLQVLRVHVDGEHLLLTETLSCMTNITSLFIKASSKHGLPGCSKVCPMLDWSALVSLKELRLHGTLRLVEEHRLSKLASLASLHTIEVAEGPTRGVAEVRQLAELAYMLGRDRPHVVLLICK